MEDAVSIHTSIMIDGKHSAFWDSEMRLHWERKCPDARGNLSMIHVEKVKSEEN